MVSWICTLQVFVNPLTPATNRPDLTRELLPPRKV